MRRLRSRSKRKVLRVLLLLCGVILLFCIVRAWRAHRIDASVCGVDVGSQDVPWTANSVTRSDYSLKDAVVHRRIPDAEHPTQVLFTVITSKVTPVLCQHLASAYLSGIPVAVVGDGVTFSYMKKMTFALNASELAGLRDEDVVLYMDSDTFFTGADPWVFLDRFIRMSPVSGSSLDVRAVRSGRAMAPVITSSEAMCSAWQTLGTDDACKGMWRSLKRLYRDVYAPTLYEKHGMKYPTNLMDESLYPTQYLNSGVIVARVWALRELNDGMQKILRMGIQSIDNHQPITTCDQSALHYLHYNLMLYEMQFDTFRLSSPTNCLRAEPSGLRAGLIDLDYHQHVSTLSGLHDLMEMRASRDGGSTLREERSFFDKSPAERHHCVAHSRLADFLARNPPSLDDHGPTLGRVSSAKVPQRVHPFFARRPQGNEGIESYPFILHFANVHKLDRMAGLGPYMAWGIPVLTNASARQEALHLLRSSVIVTYGPDRLPTPVNVSRYADVCPNPFLKWGLYSR